MDTDSLLFPEFHFRQVEADGFGFEDRILAFGALTLVILKGFDGDVAQNKAGRNIDEAHETHEDIGNRPDGGHRHACTDEDGDDANGAEGRHELLSRFAAVNEVDAVIDVEQVADERRKSKQYHAEGNQHRAETAVRRRGSLLDVYGTGRFFRNGHAGAQAEESRRAADEHRVDEDGQHLYQTLLYGMADVSRRGGVRSRADTGFVGEQAALDAVNHARTGHAAQNRFKIKGVGKDHGKYAGNFTDMEQYDKQGR